MRVGGEMTPAQYAKMLTDNDVDGKPWSEISTPILKKILSFYHSDMRLYGIRIPAIEEELSKRKDT